MGRLLLHRHHMEILLGTPRHVTPGGELGASSSYGSTPAPHRFLLPWSALRRSMVSSARRTSAANMACAATAAASGEEAAGSAAVSFAAVGEVGEEPAIAGCGRGDAAREGAQG